MIRVYKNDWVNWSNIYSLIKYKFLTLESTYEAVFMEGFQVKGDTVIFHVNLSFVFNDFQWVHVFIGWTRLLFRGVIVIFITP